MEPYELARWRNDRGYTQSELGQKLGVTKTTIYRWEKGMRVIPSFLHLALRCLELERGEKDIKGKTRKKTGTKGKGVNQ
jgi:DNA-binding XRE family transcriptional regulator